MPARQYAASRRDDDFRIAMPVRQHANVTTKTLAAITNTALWHHTDMW
jgi:hypothetical protein